MLDEPTAFSDAKNEADLMRAFHALMQNKTVIMVAHRLFSITQADQIIYLENGKIIAQGNHQALLQANVAYQTLWQNINRQNLGRYIRECYAILL